MLSYGRAATVAGLTCTTLTASGAITFSTISTDGLLYSTSGVVNSTASTTKLFAFAGSASNLALSVKNAKEPGTVSATAATGTINYYTSAQSFLYYTSNAAANWTINLTHDSTPTTLNTVMNTGDVVTAAHFVTQGGTAYYNNVVQVDGTTSGVTTVWLGGAPTAGNQSGVDGYTYAVLKTGNATFTVFATLVQFK